MMTTTTTMMITMTKTIMMLMMMSPSRRVYVSNSSNLKMQPILLGSPFFSFLLILLLKVRDKEKTRTTSFLCPSNYPTSHNTKKVRSVVVSNRLSGNGRHEVIADWSTMHSLDRRKSGRQGVPTERPRAD